MLVYLGPTYLLAPLFPSLRRKSMRLERQEAQGT